MDMTDAQLESILAGVLVNGQPLTIPEIRLIVKALTAYNCEPTNVDRTGTIILRDALNEILIARG